LCACKLSLYYIHINDHTHILLKNLSNVFEIALRKKILNHLFGFINLVFKEIHRK